MNYKIENERLSVVISDLGAEIQSIRDTEGTEYFWDGNKDIWPKHGPNLFPYLSSLTDGKYIFEGKTYEMGLHGFVPYSHLEVTAQDESAIVFSLQANEETLACYPFRFVYQVSYKLDENRLSVKYVVRNDDNKTMYFGIGAHPAFHLPFENGLCFEDYQLTFEHPCNPTRIVFAREGAGGVAGEEPYPVTDHHIPLRHDLFDRNAIVLREAGHSVELSSAKGRKGIKISFPDMTYLGIWHKPKTQVPFVCLEPWSSLPSREGIVEDFSKQENLVALEAGKTYINTWTMEFLS